MEVSCHWSCLSWCHSISVVLISDIIQNTQFLLIKNRTRNVYILSWNVTQYNLVVSRMGYMTQFPCSRVLILFRWMFVYIFVEISECLTLDLHCADRTLRREINWKLFSVDLRRLSPKSFLDACFICPHWEEQSLMARKYFVQWISQPGNEGHFSVGTIIELTWWNGE